MANILVIEDNADNLALMTYLLGAFGHHVDTASDGVAGMARAAAGRFDLIICDVHMPRADGYTVARTLKADPQLAGIPLVAVTALAMVGDRDKVLAAGFDGYLTKPIEPQTFLGQIDAFLPAGLRHSKTPRGGTQALRLLLVGDTAFHEALPDSLLQDAGQIARRARTLPEAWASLTEQTIDAVLLGDCLADAPGLSFARSLRADPARLATSIVLLVPPPVPDELRTTAQAAGVDRILARPPAPATLRETLTQCVSARRGEGAWRPS